MLRNYQDFVYSTATSTPSRRVPEAAHRAGAAISELSWGAEAPTITGLQRDLSDVLPITCHLVISHTILPSLGLDLDRVRAA